MLKVPFGGLSEPQRLDCLNWPAWPYKPSVEFRIGYDDAGIHLEWTVDEQTIRAKQAMPKAKVVHINNCVPHNIFQSTAQQEVRKRLNLPLDKKILVF